MTAAGVTALPKLGQFVWSPTGNAAAQLRTDEVAVVHTDGTRTVIARDDPNALEDQMYVQFMRPIFSRDGRWLVFQSEEKGDGTAGPHDDLQRRTLAYDLRSGSLRTILQAGLERNPWLLDVGQSTAYVQMMTETVAVDLITGQQRRYKASGGNGYGTERHLLSPDEQHIVIPVGSGVTQILDLDTGQAHGVGEAGWAFVDWSNNSDLIILIDNRGPAGTFLYVAERNGPAVEVTRLNAPGFFTPDGWITYTRDEQLRRIRPDATNDSAVWGPVDGMLGELNDGSAVFMTGKAVCKARTPDERATALVRSPSRIQLFDASPTGNALVVLVP